MALKFKLLASEITMMANLSIIKEHAHNILLLCTYIVCVYLCRSQQLMQSHFQEHFKSGATATMNFQN